MYELNLGFDNRVIYAGCSVDRVSGGRHRLNTGLDSAVIILAGNLLELLKVIPREERDCLVLTGPVPAVMYLTAQSILGPFFGKVEWHDGKGLEVTIPQPPAHFDDQE